MCIFKMDYLDTKESEELTLDETESKNSKLLIEINNYFELMEEYLKILEIDFIKNQKEKKSVIFLLIIQIYRNLNSIKLLIMRGYYEEAIIILRTSYEKIILSKYLSVNKEKLKRYLKNEHILIEELAKKHPEWKFNEELYDKTSDFIHSNFPCTQYQIIEELKLLRVKSIYYDKAFNDSIKGLIAFMIHFLSLVLKLSEDKNKERLLKIKEKTLLLNKLIK